MSIASRVGKPGILPCPICGKESMYSVIDDRFFHRDGSNNYPCWLRIWDGEAEVS